MRKIFIRLKEGIHAFLRGFLFSADQSVVFPVRKTKFSRSLSETFSDTAVRHATCFSLVVVLFQFCSPSTISRFVVPVRVLPVQCLPFGAFPHITYEGREAVQPSVTYFNPATAVVVKTFSPWVQASVLHVRPALVSGNPFGDVPKPVVLAYQAAAAFNEPPFYVWEPLFTRDTTFTLASDKLRFFGYSSNREFSKDHPDAFISV